MADTNTQRSSLLLISFREQQHRYVLQFDTYIFSCENTNTRKLAHHFPYKTINLHRYHHQNTTPLSCFTFNRNWQWNTNRNWRFLRTSRSTRISKVANEHHTLRDLNSKKILHTYEPITQIRNYNEHSSLWVTIFSLDLRNTFDKEQRINFLSCKKPNVQELTKCKLVADKTEIKNGKKSDYE